MLIEILPDFWLRHTYVTGVMVDGPSVRVYADTGNGVYWERANFCSHTAAWYWAKRLRARLTKATLTALYRGVS